MASVKDKHPNIHVVIAGDGYEREALAQLCIDLEVTNHVTILGFCDNIPAFLKACNLYVHPAIIEPFGIAIIEAMAAKKCVIATGIEGALEIVQNGETGILVAPMDSEEIAAAIINIYKNPDTSRTMGEKGRQRVEEVFDIRVTLEKYQNVYKKLCNYN